MKRFLVLLVLGGLGALGWYFYPEISAFFKPPKVPPIVQFAHYADKQIPSVLSSLSAGPGTGDKQALMQARETFKGLSLTDGIEKAQVNAAAIHVCDVLIQALDERQVYYDRLMKVDDNMEHGALAYKAPQDVQKRRKFFMDGVERTWAERAFYYQGLLDRDYALIQQAASSQ
jgi:hypothetical protein